MYAVLHTAKFRRLVCFPAHLEEYNKHVYVLNQIKHSCTLVHRSVLLLSLSRKEEQDKWISIILPDRAQTFSFTSTTCFLFLIPLLPFHCWQSRCISSQQICSVIGETHTGSK